MGTRKVNYPNAIKKVLEAHGGSVSLGTLYSEIWNHIDRSKTHGKTPDASIRRALQTSMQRGKKRFKRLRVGHWALADYTPPKTAEKEEERNHTEIQGMLLEIGKNRQFETYSADKKKKFEGKTLEERANHKECPVFTYKDRIKDYIGRIDVIWFNERGYPYKAFEVEHTTRFKDAFERFLELRDFQTEFVCVAQEEERDKFKERISRDRYKFIRKRVEFWSYDKVEREYTAILM